MDSSYRAAGLIVAPGEVEQGRLAVEGLGERFGQLVMLGQGQRFLDRYRRPRHGGQRRRGSGREHDRSSATTAAGAVVPSSEASASRIRTIASSPLPSPLRAWASQPVVLAASSTPSGRAMRGRRGLEVVDGHARSSRRRMAIRPARPVKVGLLGLVRAQLGGLQVGGLGRLRGADGLGPLGGQHVGATRPRPELLGVRHRPSAAL